MFNREFAISVNSFSNENNLFCNMELFLKSCLCGNVGLLKSFSSVYNYHPENLSDNINKNYNYIIGNTDHVTRPYEFALKYNKLSESEINECKNSILSFVFSSCLKHTKYNFLEMQEETIKFLKSKNNEVLENILDSNIYKFLMAMDKVHLFKLIYKIQKNVKQKNIVSPSNFVSFIHKIQRIIIK